jgi:hypothetical protein
MKKKVDKNALFYFINVAFLIPTTSPHYFRIRVGNQEYSSSQFSVANQNGKTGRRPSSRKLLAYFFCIRLYYAGQKILAVIVCQFKKKKICNPYFIVIMITVLIMNVIFWVVNFKTQNYFVISTTQNVYLRLSMYDCSNFVYSCRIFGISELETV